MKLLSYLLSMGGEKVKKTPATLAEFLLYTTKKEKMELFTKAAQKSNEDQRGTFNRAKA